MRTGFSMRIELKVFPVSLLEFWFAVCLEFSVSLKGFAVCLYRYKLLTKSCCKCEVELILSAEILNIIFYSHLIFDSSDKIGSLHRFMILIYFSCFLMKFILIMCSFLELCGKPGRYSFFNGSIQGSVQGFGLLQWET